MDRIKEEEINQIIEMASNLKALGKGFSSSNKKHEVLLGLKLKMASNLITEALELADIIASIEEED